MNLVNVMNFVRSKDTNPESEPKMFTATVKEIDLVKKYGIENTFLLQYDAFNDEKYVKLFHEKKDNKMELGLWLEIVRPLVKNVGLEWRGRDCDWDWHIVPGFIMAYTHFERKLLLDEAMNSFQRVFGYYPKTVGSWLMDSYSMEYLTEKYDVKAFAVCRDQTDTDAYTLIGGVINNPYFASKYNMLCPAQTLKNRISAPVFRLLCSCPIHNYELNKYMYDCNAHLRSVPATMEPFWYLGSHSDSVDWFLKTTLDNENLGISYLHIGQENSMLGQLDDEKMTIALEMQIKKLLMRNDVKVMKMSDTGEFFAEKYKFTPPSCLVAYDDWTGEDLKSVYYNCKNYVCNLFWRDNKLYIRELFDFKENFHERYYDKKCETWDAVYENLPVVDTQKWGKNPDDCGIFIDGLINNFTCTGENGILTVKFSDKSIVFKEDTIIFNNCSLKFLLGNCDADIAYSGDSLYYCYNGFEYSIKVTAITSVNDYYFNFLPDNGVIVFKFV